MTRKWIALEHPVEGSIDFIFGNFPRYERPLSKVCRKQSLPDSPDRSRAQHGGNASHHILDTHAGAIRDLLERLANKSFDLVFRNRENFCVYRIVVLNRRHSN